MESFPTSPNSNHIIDLTPGLDVVNDQAQLLVAIMTGRVPAGGVSEENLVAIDGPMRIIIMHLMNPRNRLPQHRDIYDELMAILRGTLAIIRRDQRNRLERQTDNQSAGAQTRAMLVNTVHTHQELVRNRIK